MMAVNRKKKRGAGDRTDMFNRKNTRLAVRSPGSAPTASLTGPSQLQKVAQQAVYGFNTCETIGLPF